MMTMSNEKLEQSPGEKLFEVLCSPPRLMVKSLLKRSYAFATIAATKVHLLPSAKYKLWATLIDGK